MLVVSGCWNKLSQSQWLKTMQIYFLTVAYITSLTWASHDWKSRFLYCYSFLQALLSGFVPLTFPFLQAICLLCLKTISHHHKTQQEWVIFSNPMIPPSIYLGNLRYLFPHLKLHYYISYTTPHSYSFLNHMKSTFANARNVWMLYINTLTTCPSYIA